MNNTNMEDRTLITLKDMLTDRGIKAENFDTVTVTLPESKVYTFGGVLIIDSERSRITAPEFNTIVKFANENNFSGGIIVLTPSKPSDSILQLVRKYISEKENQLIQIFYKSHLNFSYARHRKVPKHRILSAEEVEKVIKETNVLKLTNFPKIDSQDAMAKWIGARPGDVVEVTGMCMGSGENKRYRYCLANVTES